MEKQKESCFIASYLVGWNMIQVLSKLFLVPVVDCNFYYIGNSAYALKSSYSPHNNVQHGTAEDNYNFITHPQELPSNVVLER